MSISERTDRGQRCLTAMHGERPIAQANEGHYISGESYWTVALTVAAELSLGARAPMTRAFTVIDEDSARKVLDAFAFLYSQTDPGLVTA